MAFVNPKQWLGTTGDFTLVTNWQQDNIRTAQFNWTASGSGTGEFYVRLAGNTTAGFVASPPTSGGVYIDGTARTKATLGSLAVNQWGYGDNDTLGYSTIYVRLSDDSNPNTKAAGFVKFNQVPQTGEAVDIPQGSGAITSNTDYSGTTLGVVRILKSTDNRAHGSQSSPIRLTCTGFIFEGGGSTSAYYDLTTSAITPEIRSTATVDADEYGLYLFGSAVVVADIWGGSVALGVLPGQPFTCTTGVRTRGSSARVISSTNATIPLLEALAGTIDVEGSIANIEVDGGIVRTKRACAVSGAVTVTGGTWYEQSTGTKTSVVQSGGNIDATQAGGAVIWSAFTPTAGTFRDDPDRLTITSVTRPTAAGTHTWVR